MPDDRSIYPSIDVIGWVCPDVMVLGIVCLVGFPLAACAWLLRPGWGPRGARGGELSRRLGAFLRFAPLPVASWTLLVGVAIWQWLLNFNPRYLSMATPPMILVLSALLLLVLRRRWLVGVVLLDVVAFQLANSEGKYYPSLDPVHERYPLAYYLTERSRAFLRRHESDVAACRWLTKNHADRVVYTEPPFGFYLALPQLGVVEAPLRGYCYGIRSDFMPTFRHKEIGQVQPAAGQDEILVLGRVTPLYVPPRSRGDVLYMDSFDPPLVVYSRKVDAVAATVENPVELPAARWRLEADPTAGAALSVSQDGSARLDVRRPSGERGDVGVVQEGLRWRFGRRYALSLRLRSKGFTSATLALTPSPEWSGAPGDERHAAWQREIPVDGRWTNLRLEFTANADADAATIRISPGEGVGMLEIGDGRLE